MNQKTTFVSFRVKNKGGKSAGKSIEGAIPDFDWEMFKNTPNADEFVKRAYFAATKKIMREIQDQKNKTTADDLQSVEAVINRSLFFTKSEISDWMESRDWSAAKDVKDINEVLLKLKDKLPLLATRANPFSPETSRKLADKVIAAVADKPDPIADYLFSVLTQEHSDADMIQL